MTYNITSKEEEEKLVRLFDPGDGSPKAELNVDVEPDRPAKVKLNVTAPRRWIGSTVSHGLNVEAVSKATKESKTANARFLHRALLPSWAVPVMLAGVALLAWKIIPSPKPVPVTPTPVEPRGQAPTYPVTPTPVEPRGQAPTYKMVSKIKVGGYPQMGPVYVDSADHRLYTSGGLQTQVIDTTSDKLIGAIPGSYNSIRGVAVASDEGRGFISEDYRDAVTVFDLKTLRVLSKVKTGQYPQPIIYEPVSHCVFTFNVESKYDGTKVITRSDSTAIDVRTSDVITAAIPVGGMPRSAQVDGKGHIYANIEDMNEIIEVDARNTQVSKRYSIAPCDGPNGLAIDPTGRLYSVCKNKMMIISDPAAGRVLATVPIGGGAGGVAFDDGYTFSANGADGTITMVGETSPGKFEVVSTIPTMVSAGYIAADQRAHKLYLPAQELSRVWAHGSLAVPDSFQILVVGR
jgi:DNA-binding beta-propeller fold protein YncE